MPDPMERSILDDLADGEAPLSMNSARRDARLCIDNRPHDLSWIFRATSRGIRGTVLESTKIGGARVTTTSSIARFIARQAGSQNSSIQKSQATHRAHEAAERRLASCGL